MKLDIFTLFPEAFDWFRSQRSVQNAVREGNELRFFDYRETTPLGAGQVDDAPYGGGAGMVLRVDVVDAALQAAYPSGETPRVVLLSPTGRLLDDELADELTAEPHVALLCGRYEGFDERVHEHFADDEVSIGRYVLAGGELPAMVARRRRHAQAAGRPRPRGFRRRGVLQPGPRGDARVPALHPARRPTAAGRCPRSSSPATTSGCASGGSSRAAPGPSSSNAARSRYHSATARRPVRVRRFFLATPPVSVSDERDLGNATE